MSTYYPKEFKAQVVSQYRQGRTAMELGREFNLSPTTVSNWVRAADRATSVAASGSTPPVVESDQAKIARLERELARRSEDLEILGKALAFFARRADQ